MRVPLAGAAAVAVAACLAVGAIGVRPALASGDPVVMPGHLEGWHFTTNKTVSVLYDEASHNPSSSASFKFRFGPGHPPEGKGSLLMAAGEVPNSRVAAIPPGLDGTSLEALHSFSYETYLTRVGSSPLPINFKIGVISESLHHFTTLVYEPSQQSSPTAAPKRWQTWDPLAGHWWATRIADRCSHSEPCSWDAMKFRVGRTSSILGAYFELGESGDGYSGTACALDKVIINDTVYNLEPTPRPRREPVHRPHHPTRIFCRAALSRARTSKAC